MYFPISSLSVTKIIILVENTVPDRAKVAYDYKPLAMALTDLKKLDIEIYI